ncbi:hypothetical protein W97_06785 [Coniosporium apollinis CBS 100218]|uniref:Heterokaryon incompatibility domain-containing protein n=1 Tax=Coniosporium apollinis (strain CBS 100218) TaxID=1168221 RepID=R7Z0H5_CONA1|nr:uncharacterized protein W97_06785 [Coniosporium apollinis CBS 100218]EON67642.1 hypothetical protein W97_06785 [Coniosporium apollinis CBS 100218]
MADTADTVKPLYEPLDYERRQIRVLILLPGQFSDPIAGRMKIVSLDDKPEYDAMSYVWGDKTKQRTIHVNGHDVRVTLGLFLGLRQFRDESKEYPLWVDAICIDQLNQDEKCKQVSLMGDVYRQSRETQVWLGEETGSLPGLTDPQLIDKLRIALFARENGLSLPAFEGNETLTKLLLDRLLSTEKARRALRDQIAAARPFGFNGSFSHFNAFYLLEHLALNKHLHEIIGTTDGDPERLLNAEVKWTIMVYSLWIFVWNPWWHRAWVVQEIILSPKATVTYGRFSMPWPQFFRAVQNSSAHSKTCCNMDYNNLGVADRLVLRAFYLNVDGISAIKYWDSYEPGKLSVRDLLQRTRSREATYAVDKVYSLLGLQRSKGNILKLVPDYRISHSELYRNVAVWDIESSGGLHILEHCEWQLNLQFSSWVPDWTRHLGLNQNTPAINNRFESMGLYNADNLRRGKVAVLSGCILAVEGIFVDEATEVSDIMTGIWLMDILFMKKLAELPVKENYPADCSRQEALTRTMIADCFQKFPYGDGQATEPRLRRASVKDIEDYHAIWGPYLTAEVESVRVMLDIDHRADKFRPLTDSLQFASVDRRFFVTKTGYMGFGPRTMRKHDHLYVLLGGRTPFILRPDPLILPGLAVAMLDLRAPAGLDHSLIGPCFVHGIMDGEVVRDRETELRDVWLV